MGDAWEVCMVRAGRYWGIPTGPLEECALPAAALSIVATLPPSEYVYRRDGRLIFKLVHHFLVIAPAGAVLTAQAAEIDEAEWLSIDSAMATASFADSRTALAAARDAL